MKNIVTSTIYCVIKPKTLKEFWEIGQKNCERIFEIEKLFIGK